ncbi:hypothetical protein ACFYZN_25245 [Streptomyces sp. NPDC001777]|uniref:hypothetical protein n=1 Tax=Streptomyces sp. NPDC001777 TaxID=3364608 RepID=UPI00369A1B2B
MTKNEKRKSYTGRGYWAVQIGFSALLALLGLGGGVLVLIEVSRPGSTSSAGVGDGAMMLVVGVVFSLLLIWLVTALIRQSRRQRAIYAWTIMQDYAARNPGLRPLRPGKTVASDLATMETATRASDGTLSLEEVLRLQALRPEVPYPGDLGALRRKSAEQAAALLSPEEREQLRAQWDADDAEARARLNDAGILHPRTEQIVRRAGTVAGWAAIACFLLGIWTKLEALGTGTAMALVGLWCGLRLITGILQDARIRKGSTLVESWRSDPERRQFGLPAPYAEFVRTPLGSWWMRLLTPATVLGLLLLMGGAANIGSATASDERRFFIGLAVVAAALLLSSIMLRLVVGRRSAGAHDLLSELQGPRAAERAQ